MLTDVRVHRTGELVTVALAGWLTLESAPEVRGVLLKCLTDCPSGLVVDLRDLVVDSDLPLTLFPTIARQARSWPGAPPVVLFVPPGPVADRFLRTGFDRFLPVRAVLAEARAVAGTQDGDAPALRVDLPLGPEGQSAARRLVVDACRTWELSQLAGPAELIAAELAANAVQHGAPPYRLVAAARSRYLHIVARDGSPTLPELAAAGPLSERGQGLRLVSGFATAWGSLRTAGGKAVWATLRREPAAFRRSGRTPWRATAT